MEYPAYDIYQPSRFDTNVALPKDWQEKKLKFVASHNDETLSEKTDPDYEIEYVDISSVNLVHGITQTETLNFESAPSRARRKVIDGDSIVSTVRTYLKAIAAIKKPPKNMVVSTGFAVIRPSKEICKNYLAYFLQSQGYVDSVVSHSVGVSYPAINASDLMCLPVRFPVSIDEQHKIANFLDYKTQQINQLIEKKKALIKKLGEQRIAVITQAVTKGLDKNAKMKPSGVDWLGDVPVHWETRRLKFLTNEALQYGANEAAVLDDRDLPRFIRITDVKDDGDLHDDTFRSLPEDIAASFLLEEGDILMARSGATVGKSFKYSKSWGKATYAGYLIKFSVDTEIMNEDYAYFYFQSSVYWANINSTLIQATIQNFSAEKYANIELPLPGLENQLKIVGYLNGRLDRIAKMRSIAMSVVERLEEYRNSLITDSVTGKIDVRNIDLPGRKVA